MSDHDQQYNISSLSPAVGVARELAAEKLDTIHTFSTGVRVRVRSVSASLIDEVVARIPDPEVPLQMNEEKGRTEPNPYDPSYLAAQTAVTRARGIAAMDAMIEFGFDLVDPLPNDNLWVRKLARHGVTFNADDPFEAEFAYKKYVACGSDDLATLSGRSGLSGAEVARAAQSFPSPA